MDTKAPTLLFCPPMDLKHQGDNGLKVFDSSMLQKQTKIPGEFIWPHRDLVPKVEELNEPLVDLEGVLRGEQTTTLAAAELVKEACLKHGFFQVINHGVEADLISSVHENMDAFFKLPITQKLRALKKPGSTWGYSAGHAGRFSSKLPWKETFSFGYHENSSNSIVEDYFKSALGYEFQQAGLVYQKYCEAMKELSLVIMELLGMSLGTDRLHYRKFFEDSNSIVRCNYYPPCQEPSLTFGTGPHCDPTSLTILLQDQVGGLEVFSQNRWQAVKPRPGALVINIGDTFMALSNGRYKSCLHRAVVNRNIQRRSVAFFVCPKEDKVVKPPQDLVGREQTRKYPDFTWSDLLEFTQNHYRADVTTLQSFTHWLLSSPQPN